MKKIILYLLFIQLPISFLIGQNECGQLENISLSSEIRPIHCSAYDNTPMDILNNVNDSIFFANTPLTGKVHIRLYRTPEIDNDIIQSSKEIATIRGLFINGIKEGLWSKYINDKGEDKLIVNETYLNGQLHGVRNIFDISGKKISSVLFIKGTGVYKEYYKSTNQIQRTGMLLNGKRNGTWICYRETGDCRKIENYKNGILHGQYKILKNDGTILYETVFNNGTGQYRSYNDKGELIENGMMERGDRIGKWVENLYYIDRYDDTRKSRQLELTYTKESTINKHHHTIDVFYVDGVPFYVKVNEKKCNYE